MVDTTTTPAGDEPPPDARRSEKPGAGHDDAVTGPTSENPTWERLEDQLRWYSTASRTAKSRFQRFKVAELIVAAIVPVVAALQVPAAVIAVLAALVVIAEGVRQVFGRQRDWLACRDVLQALEREKALFLADVDT